DERSTASRWDLLRFAARDRHPPPAPEVRVDEYREVHGSQAADQPVEAGGVVELRVATHYCLDGRRVDIEFAHVLRDVVGADSGVEKDPVFRAVLGHSH